MLTVCWSLRLGRKGDPRGFEGVASSTASSSMVATGSLPSSTYLPRTCCGLSGRRVLACPGCRDKIPETRRVKKQTFTSHSPGGWKAKVMVTANSVPGTGGPSSWPAGWHFLCVLTGWRESNLHPLLLL